MVWKYGDIQLKAGKSWTDKDGTKHPNNWMIWDDEDKKSFGLTWEDDVDTSFDDKFYWSKGVERKLADTNEVDDDGKAIIDPITGKQQITLGLKSIWIERTKSTANGLLTASDWYMIRNVDSGKAIPSKITEYRKKVRVSADTIETKINNCETLNAFKLLFDVPLDSDNKPTGNAPIYDFPSEVE
jgi:hypothetical protein